MIYGDVINDHLRLDVRDFAKQGILKSRYCRRVELSSQSTKNIGAICAFYKNGRIFIEAKDMRSNAEQDILTCDIGLQYTDVNFGGQRPWWTCPYCGRRCAILYLGYGQQWLCRECLRLPYSSQGFTTIESLSARVERAQQHLGPDGQRKKGQHQRTYSLRLHDLFTAHMSLKEEGHKEAQALKEEMDALNARVAAKRKRALRREPKSDS